jgi:hypothetical protein
MKLRFVNFRGKATVVDARLTLVVSCCALTGEKECRQMVVFNEDAHETIGLPAGAFSEYQLVWATEEERTSLRDAGFID